MLVCCFAAFSAFANIPGGGTGTGPNVTLLNSGNGNFVTTNTIHPNWPQSFYRLELQ